MAGEIRINLQFNVDKGEFSDSFSVLNKAFDQAAIGGGTPGYVTIGTTEESVQFTELGTEGWIILKNLDTTNYVQWGFATTVYGGRIAPASFAIFQAEPNLTLYLKANTAACKMQIKGYEA